MFYRFRCGTFQEADTFEEAKEKFIKRIEEETENVSKWSECTCLGFEHRFDCPEKHKDGVPF